MSATTLGEILAHTEIDSDAPPTTPIPRERVYEWMQSEDAEALGAVRYLISDPRHYPRIQPPLEFEDGFSFYIKYYELCFREDPHGEWSDSRYITGSEVVSWFISLWREPSVPLSALDEIKDWLGKLYRSGDHELRTCIVDATLEHLFEQNQIREYFADWQNDPILKTAYTEGLRWVEGGGKTMFGAKQHVRNLDSEN